MNGASLELNVGGLVGQNIGTITDSLSKSDIVIENSYDSESEEGVYYESKSYVGGICGYNEKNVTRVISDNTITVTNGGKLYLGSIVGYSQTGTIDITYSNSKIGRAHV